MSAQGSSAPLVWERGSARAGADTPEPDLAAEWPLPLPVVLPELRVLPTPMQLFMFSAITWNRHHIHYSADGARAEGHPDVVVQRSLMGNFFARHAGAWLGSAGRVSRLVWRVTGSAVPNQWLRCNGVVQDLVDDAAEAEDGLLRVRYQAWLTADGDREVASAEGVLCIQSMS